MENRERLRIVSHLTKEMKEELNQIINVREISKEKYLKYKRDYECRNRQIDNYLKRCRKELGI